MNKREKTLVILLMGVLLVFGLKQGRSTYSGIKSDLQGEISDIRKKKKDLEKEKQLVRAAEDLWREIGAQTLATDPVRAKNLLREQLLKLASDTGLGNALPDLRNDEKEGKYGLRRIGARITAETDLATVRKFMYAMHRQPYVMRCKSLKLTPITERQTGADRNDPMAKVQMPTGRFRMEVTLETLILPVEPYLPTISTAKLNDPDAPVPEGRLRPTLAAVAEYTSITQSMFERFIPVDPPTKAVARNPSLNQQIEVKDEQTPKVQLNWTPGQRAQKHVLHVGASPAELKEIGEMAETNWALPEDMVAIGNKVFWRVDEIGEGGRTQGDLWQFAFVKERVPEPPKVPDPVITPPEPRYPESLVRGVLSGTRVQQAVLSDTKNPTAPDTRISIGDELDIGWLIYVHHTGVVTEERPSIKKTFDVSGKVVKEEEIYPSGRTRWFHPVGSVVNQKQVLNEAEHPAVFHAVQELEAKLTRSVAGIRGSE